MNSVGPNGVSQGGPDPNSDGYETTGVDSLNLASEGHDGVDKGIQPPPGDGLDRMYGGGSVSNDGSSLAK